MKISLSMLERARKSPKAAAAASLRKFGGIKPNFPMYWVLAVKRYHQLAAKNNQNALEEARRHFSDMCQAKLIGDPEFEKRITALSRELDRYEGEYRMLGYPFIQTDKRVKFKIGMHLVTGSIGRLDMNPASGYVATQFEARSSDWPTQLRTAIVQKALAVELGCGLDEIKVGTYCIERHAHQYTTLSLSKVESAIEELEKILLAVELEVRRIKQQR